jgi:tripartite-type tricarboxylate transporter receptor subunit TctC
VRIIVPFPPGQAADIIARTVAERLSITFGQQVIVDNRPGAGSVVGSELAAKSPPDGYTFLAGGTSALAINVNLYRKLPYDTLRDFAPVTNMTEVAMIFCVNPALPATNARQLIAIAKQRPDDVTYGSSGSGTVSHLAQELLASMAGVKLRHIPYKGSIPNIMDVLAGQIMMTAETTPTVLPHVKAGKMRAIAVSPNTRVTFMPDVPTLDEQGLKGYDVRAWTGLVAPIGTPAPILDRMNQEVVKAVTAPEMQKRIYDLQLVPVGSTREQFTAYLKSEIAKWGHAVKVSGATIE